MTNWQDISTAPKDGTVFLAYWHEMPCFVAWVGDGFRVLVNSSRPEPMLGVHGNFKSFTPHHWMPLPPPPSEEV